jgi:molybdopterin converting factor small subunit
MTQLRLPTALRNFADNQKEVELKGTTVRGALEDLSEMYPALQPHLFDEGGQLRPYINLFLNDTDIRNLQGIDTRLGNGDRLLLIPSIAGGGDGLTPVLVDVNALKTHQAILIGMLAGAFIADSTGVIALLALVMLSGTVRGKPGFLPLYDLLVRLGRLAPAPQPDRPEPHRFAHVLGTLFLIASTASFALGYSGTAWALALVVALLACLNLFAGFCAGCAMYYWLARLGVPRFQPPLEHGQNSPGPEDSY